MNEKLVRPIFRFFNSRTKNAEIYINNGSVWLIFTNEKRWVFELTKEGTLWYNYYFFENILKYFSLEVVKNQDYITKWVENFIQNGVKRTDGCQIGTSTSVEDTIQNGVKNTTFLQGKHYEHVEDAIQNGIKETKHNPFEDGLAMEEAIQNGVKDIKMGSYLWGKTVEDTIQNGVKDTFAGALMDETTVEDTIQNGVKEAVPMLIQTDGNVEYTIQNGVKRTTPASSPCWKLVEDVVQNGVKETTPGGYLGSVEMKGKMVHQFESPKQNNEVEDTIQNGVKEIKGISDSSLSSEIFKIKCKQTIREGVKHTEMEEHHRLREVVQTVNNGIKNTVNHPARPQEVVDNIINNGIKQTESIASHRTWKSEEVIQNGIKEANPHFLEILNPMNFEPTIKEMKRMNEVNVVLENGIKETKTPNDQNFVDTLNFLDYNGSHSVPELIDEVVQNGIKEVKELPDKSGMLLGYGEYYARREDKTYPHTDIVNKVIRDGIEETKYCELHSLMRADHIIRDGIKETHWKRVDNHPTFVDRIIEITNPS